MDKLFLNQIEIDVINKCNLNCASCTHFSPLTTSIDKYELNIFENDIIRLSNLFVIDKIKLVGGEPFLRDDLDKLVNIIHLHFPLTKISIFTNGILEKQINEFKNKFPWVKIVQSKYPIIPELNIENKDKTNFKHPMINLKGNSNPIISKMKCHSKNCLSLSNGRLYICPIMRNIKLFENYFNINLDLKLNDYSIDIYNNDCLSILDFLFNFNKGLKCCRFCSESSKTIKWELSSKDIKEWVAD